MNGIFKINFFQTINAFQQVPDYLPHRVRSTFRKATQNFVIIFVRKFDSSTDDIHDYYHYYIYALAGAL